MAGNPFLPVATASVSWVDPQGLHIHVFTTDGFTVTERAMVPGQSGWINGTLPATAEANDISAACWVDSDGGHIRLYCTAGDATTEWCLDGEGSAWYRGSYTLS